VNFGLVKKFCFIAKSNFQDLEKMSLCFCAVTSVAGLGANWILLHCIPHGNVVSIIFGVMACFMPHMLPNPKSTNWHDVIGQIWLNSVLAYSCVSFGVCLMLPTIVKTLW